METRQRENGSNILTDTAGISCLTFSAHMSGIIAVTKIL